MAAATLLVVPRHETLVKPNPNTNRASPGLPSYMLNTWSEEHHTAFYSKSACFEKCPMLNCF